jgi:hypothetical protein
VNARRKQGQSRQELAAPEPASRLQDQLESGDPGDTREPASALVRRLARGPRRVVPGRLTCVSRAGSVRTRTQCLLGYPVVTSSRPRMRVTWLRGGPWAHSWHFYLPVVESTYAMRVTSLANRQPLKPPYYSVDVGIQLGPPVASRISAGELLSRPQQDNRAEHRVALWRAGADPGSCSGSIRNVWISLGDSSALFRAAEAVCPGRVSGPGSVDTNLTLYKLECIIAS